MYITFFTFCQRSVGGQKQIMLFDCDLHNPRDKSRVPSWSKSTATGLAADKFVRPFSGAMKPAGGLISANGQELLQVLR